MANLIRDKIKFIDRFKRSHSLRLHMSLILLATVCAGLLATRIMLALEVHNVMVRYPLAVIFAYLVFFIAMKLWLKYVASLPATHKAHDNSPNLPVVFPEAPSSGPSDGYVGVGGTIRAGGGEFSGGGASGDFGEAEVAVTESGSGILSGGMNTGGGIGDAVGDAAGEAASSLGDEGGIVAVVIFLLLAAILAVVVGAGIYLVYEAPFVLSEAAFEVVLAAGLVRGSRRVDSADWVGSVVKTTWMPFAVTLALALLTGYLIHHYFPGVTRISELLSLL